MSGSMIFSKGDLQAHGIWVGSCFWFLLFVPQVLEAVGRKDLWALASVLSACVNAGTISIESKRSVGTTIQVHLPISVP